MAKARIGYDDVRTMLLDGGYFRAKLHAVLTPFDIVAGGLSWAVLNSRCHIDVEFVENATIGDKIRVAEEICAGLKDEMACPHDLRPHQIQGLDYPAIAQVLEWLLRRVAAARAEHAYFTRQFTRLDFARRFKCPLAVPTPVPGEAAAPHQQLHCHNPRRVASGHAAPPRTQVLSVEAAATAAAAGAAEHAGAVLLEYGDEYVVTEQAVVADDEVALYDAVQLREAAAQREAEQQERSALQALLNTMASHTERGKASSSALGTALAAADTRKLAKLTAQFEARKAELAAQLEAEQKERRKAQHRRERVETMGTEADALEPKLAKYAAQIDAAEAAAQARRENAEAEEETARAEVAAAKAELEATTEDPAVRAAMAEAEKLQAEEAAARAALDEDTAEKQRDIAETKADVATMQQRLADHEAATEDPAAAAEMARHDAALGELHTALHHVSREVTALQRRIDHCPTPLELTQYRARLEELDVEMAWKFEETRLAFTRHNTRAEVQECLSNERDAFSSVRAEFDAATGPKAPKGSQAAWLEGIQAFVDQLAQSLDAQNSRLGSERTALRTVLDKCEDLQSRRRRHGELLAEVRATMEKLSAAADPGDEGL